MVKKDCNKCANNYLDKSNNVSNNFCWDCFSKINFKKKVKKNANDTK